ncbi:DUF4230 domain-containing protein [Actinomadura sp. LOL_016]|uniref:DUF4230 domain-containing protein n=1 Tax=unclassified Actinomadura TaxID=2626254 RepID=UPI003A812D0D
MASEKPNTDTPSRPLRPLRFLRGPVLLVVATVVVVLVGLQLLRGLGLPDWANPFGTETKDRSGPVLLKSIQDLRRYEAASGAFQVIVDLEKDAKFLPGSLRGERTLFVGNGTVGAFVDFSKLGAGAIKVNADRTAATITLPPARLEKTNLDTENSYVHAAERGLFDRFGDFFSSNPNDQQQLYVLAGEKIQDAAAKSGLRERADANTRSMLTNMLRALGFESVKFTAPAQ